jgi:uncharacterized membrane protein
MGSLQMGRFLVVLGVILVACGLILMAGGRFSSLGLGHLPGDIVYKGKNFQFYFPITTCLVLSAAVTLIFWLISYLSKK